jgi:hypothetical protein
VNLITKLLVIETQGREARCSRAALPSIVALPTVERVGAAPVARLSWEGPPGEVSQRAITDEAILELMAGISEAVPPLCGGLDIEAAKRTRMSFRRRQ